MNENKKQDEAEIAYCPNCNQPAIRRGKVIDCEKCDASFRFTTEGAKVEKVGAIADHESRLRALEEKAGMNQAQPEPEPEPEPEPTKNDDL